jgi:hypothetical protein
MSRGEARRVLRQADVDAAYRKAGVVVNTDGVVPIDESKDVYKSSREVVEAHSSGPRNDRARTPAVSVDQGGGLGGKTPSSSGRCFTARHPRCSGWCCVHSWWSRADGLACRANRRVGTDPRAHHRHHHQGPAVGGAAPDRDRLPSPEEICLSLVTEWLSDLSSVRLPRTFDRESRPLNLPIASAPVSYS